MSAAMVRSVSMASVVDSLAMSRTASRMRGLPPGLPDLPLAQVVVDTGLAGPQIRGGAGWGYYTTAIPQPEHPSLCQAALPQPLIGGSRTGSGASGLASCWSSPKPSARPRGAIQQSPNCICGVETKTGCLGRTHPPLPRDIRRPLIPQEKCA